MTAVEQLDIVQTKTDPDFRETKAGTKGLVFRDPLLVPGQIKWGVADRYRRSSSGDLNDADGHIAYLRTDLECAGLSLKKGDRVTNQDDTSQRYVLIEVQPVAHYQGRHTMVLAFFKRLYGNP